MTQRTGITEITAPVAAGSPDTPLAVHFANEQQGGLKYFADNNDRDAFTKKFRVRCFKSVAYVASGENNYPSIYQWTGTQSDGTDGSWKFVAYAGGFVLADDQGGIPKLISSLVVTSSFAIQAAGDQGGAAILDLSPETLKQIAAKVAGDGLISVGTYKDPDTFEKGNMLELEWPLKAWPDADKDKAFRVSMDHSAFEPLHKPGFLAYLSYGVEVAGKESDGPKGHHDGKIWFDEIVVPTNAYIGSDMATKSFTIEEADELDPNVSGGTDYLIAFRVGLKGTAPNDGFVRAYIYDSSINPYMKNGYMEDCNGQPMLVERHYKAGDKLGFLDIVGVVNAKGQQGFSCHVVDNFSDDMLNVTDPYYGETALMIQCLASDSRTGLARLQYQQDIGEKIRESARYVGESLFNIAFFTQVDLPIQTSNAGMGQTQIDGAHFYNVSKMAAGVVDGHVVLKDDGSDICDFSFGNIFDAELTQILAGKEVAITTTITNKDSAFRIELASWTGEPDKYTPEIFTSRNNDSPIYQANWAEKGNTFIAENPDAEDTQHNFVFTVPSDAKNFAIIILPVAAQQPMELKLKQFKVDAQVPFNAYSIRASEMVGEQRGVWNPEHFAFVQNTQGYGLLRYTVNSKWTPMPVGEPNPNQNKDITLDPSKNKIAGSNARGGEGVITFNKEGVVDGSSYVDFFAWNEQGSDDDITVRVVMLHPDTGIADPEDKDLYISEGSMTVPAGSKGSKHLFHIPEKQVEQGEQWAIFAKSNKDDGAFLQCASDKNPLMQVEIKLKALSSVTYTLSDEGNGQQSVSAKRD